MFGIIQNSQMDLRIHSSIAIPMLQKCTYNQVHCLPVFLPLCFKFLKQTNKTQFCTPISNPAFALYHPAIALTDWKNKKSQHPLPESSEKWPLNLSFLFVLLFIIMAELSPLGKTCIIYIFFILLKTREVIASLLVSLLINMLLLICNNSDTL